jgi:hypothetical protein
MTRCHYTMTCILVLANINQWWTADYVSWDHEQPWLQDDISKSMEMKFSLKYQWDSFLDHQDGWRITDKQRRTALHHAVGEQRLSRRNLSLHLQWTPIYRPRINKIKKGWWNKIMQLSASSSPRSDSIKKSLMQGGGLAWRTQNH